MEGSTAPVVESRALTKRFGHVVALDRLDLEVPRHSIFGFLGPNGAGKTTLMRVLLGLTRPTEGEAKVFGLDVVGDSLEIRKRVGYLSQHPTFYNDLSCRETLRYARGFFPLDGARAVDEEIEEVLALVGMSDKADRRVEQLSGGEKQRLGIAQAQIHSPELLILDEPASALDPLGRRDVLDIMTRLKESTTIFYSTHILDDVERVSDTVAIVLAGRRVAQAPIDDLLGSQEPQMFELTIGAGGSNAAALLSDQPWVRSVERFPGDDGEKLLIEADDDDLAERLLLRTVLEDPNVVVLAFGRQRSELEKVFVSLVEAES